MPRIEDYALVGDTQTAALISRAGAVDWAPFPRFDSGSCFAALLGDRDHGRWSIAPAPDVPVRGVTRRYRPGTLVLETDFETDGGAVRVIDFMPVRGPTSDLVRIVEGLRGSVPMRFDLVMRFDYGRVVPWVRREQDALLAVAGPDALCLRSDLDLRGEDLATVADFSIVAGERRATVCTWFPSHQSLPTPVDAAVALRETEDWWRAWSERCQYQGRWREPVLTSLMLLKALTYGPTGGIVAAPTTSLPERLGGVRNWDYRYCWLRDSTLTLYALMLTGYTDEAKAWREWLLRAAAGDPAKLQIMYSVSGERRLDERELDWLPGYEGSHPVRIGNLAHGQLQLDVYGELVDTLYEARRLSARCWTSWRRAGTSPTRASGRCAARAASSPTQRSWRGSRSTAPFAPSKSSASRRTAPPRPWLVGARCAIRFTPRYARAASISRATRSRNPTDPRCWTRAC
jgi:GH15 family glucan-1,4-alpha-glucosidase